MSLCSKMKFHISRPPSEGENANERIDRLISWLALLSEGLNVTLENLTEENFTERTREKLFSKEEKEE